MSNGQDMSQNEPLNARLRERDEKKELKNFIVQTIIMVERVIGCNIRSEEVLEVMVDHAFENGIVNTKYWDLIVSRPKNW